MEDPTAKPTVQVITPAPVPVSTPQPTDSQDSADAASKWTILSGDCVISDDGNCVSDGDGDYQNSMFCEFTHAGDANIVVEEFRMETYGESSCYDYLAFPLTKDGGYEYFCNDDASDVSPPSEFTVGSDEIKFFFSSDSATNMEGFRLCSEGLGSSSDSAPEVDSALAGVFT